MHQEHQIQKFTCGKAVFKNNLKKYKEMIKKSKKIKTTLEGDSWSICDEDYQKYNWKQIFLRMSECLAEQIDLQNNDRFQIILQIQFVQYSNLKQLFLYGNNINNIESLSSIHFNCLTYLGIGNNEISQIKCLNKLSYSSLDFIDLDNNPLIEINALTRSKINSERFASLVLQYFVQYDPINQDLSVLVKLNAKSAGVLSNLLINMRNSIKQKNQSSSSIVNVIEIPFSLNGKIIILLK